MSDPELSYCAHEVRRFDNDRFLTALFAPADRREDLFALYAFNLEIAKTREVVSEPTLGLIRLQWWRETLDKVFSSAPPKHEVAEPLATAVARHGLDRAEFERLVDAREADLDDDPPASLDCLANYAAVTAGPLTRLAVRITGVRDDASMSAATHVGTAFALAGILRAVPFLARAHRHRLPSDLMVRYGVSEPKLFDLKPEPGIRDVVKDVATRAAGELAQARALRSRVPKPATPALLTASLAGLHLRSLQKENYDPLAARVQMAHPFRQLILGWAGVSGRW